MAKWSQINRRGQPRKKPRRLKKPIVVGRHDVTVSEPGKGITVPTHHQCCTCPNYGVDRRVHGGEQFIDWYVPGSTTLIATEPWPWASKSPYCPPCWKAIKEKRG